MESPLSDVTNVPATTPVKAPVVEQQTVVVEETVVVPPPPPAAEATPAAAPDAAKPIAWKVADTVCKAVSIARSKVDTNDPRSLLICSNLLLAVLYLASTHALALTTSIMMAAITCGVATSSFSGRAPRAMVIDAAMLEALVPSAVTIANKALAFYQRVFQCGEPRDALIGMLSLWAIKIASAYLSNFTLLAIVVNMGHATPFVTNAAGPRLAELFSKLEQAVTPTAKEYWPYIAVFAALVWISFDLSTKCVTLAIGILSVKAWSAEEAALTAMINMKRSAKRLSVTGSQFVMNKMAYVSPRKSKAL